jgi:hypothetical protein
MVQAFSTFRGFLLSSVGVRPPSSFFQRQIHLFNLLTRCALLCIGSTLLYTQGVRCVPGIVSQPYMKHLWVNATHMDWNMNRLPPLQTLAAPNNALMVIVWYSVVLCLFICDFFRCALMSSNNWSAGANQIDMSWVAITWSAIPLLFAIVAVLLGTRDGSIILLIIALTCFSGICGFVVESLRSVVNPHTIVGMTRSVLYLLRLAQEGLFLLAGEVVLIPFIFNLVHDNETIDIVTIVVASLFGCLLVVMLITTYQYNSMCNRFEQAWPTQHSILSWDVHPLIPSSQDRADAIHENDVVVVPSDSTLDYSITRVDLVYASEFHEIPFKPTPLAKDDYTGSRATIGQLNEWRRYYMINTFFDMILIISILIITGMTTHCDF